MQVAGTSTARPIGAGVYAFGMDGAAVKRYNNVYTVGATKVRARNVWENVMRVCAAPGFACHALARFALRPGFY
jgi:hypothetical protein